MPITRDVAWYNSGSRPMMKVRDGAVTADVEQGDVASCAVDQGALAACAITTGNLAACSITCTALADGHVVSQKASNNLVMRSFLVVVDPPEPSGLISGGSSIGGWSTTYKVWRTLTPIVIERVQAFVHRAYELACNDSFTLYGNSGTCIGDIYFCGQSTALAGGTRVAGSTANFVLVNLPACTDVIAKWAISTCSVAAPVSLQFDYLSSN